MYFGFVSALRINILSNSYTRVSVHCLRYYSSEIQDTILPAADVLIKKSKYSVKKKSPAAVAETVSSIIGGIATTAKESFPLIKKCSLKIKTTATTNVDLTKSNVEKTIICDTKADDFVEAVFQKVPLKAISSENFLLYSNKFPLKESSGFEKGALNYVAQENNYVCVSHYPLHIMTSLPLTQYDFTIPYAL